MGIKSLFIQFNEHCNDSSVGNTRIDDLFTHTTRCTQLRTEEEKG